LKNVLEKLEHNELEEMSEGEPEKGEKL